jgi:hypothetical protein
MRIMRAATGLVLVVVVLGLMTAARAETATAVTRALGAAQAANSELSAQSRRSRPRIRVRIYREDERGVYPSYNPGPDAVRECSATYVQEYRPSGTVIVPRVNCFWRHG